MVRTGAHKLARRRPAECASRQCGRTRFDRLLVELSLCLVGPGPAELAAALAPLAKYLGADRVMLLEYDTEARQFNVAAAWVAPGIPRLTMPLPADDLPWILPRVLANRPFTFRSPEDLPAKARAEKSWFTRLGTQAHLIMPLHAEQQVLGLLWCDTVRGSRTWATAALRRMRFVADGFANALLHQRTRQMLRRQHDELAHAGRMAAMGELTAALSHELNQPLTALLANAQAARKSLRGGNGAVAEVDEILADIADAAVRATEIIRRVRGMLRKDGSRRELLDLSEVVGEILPVAQTEARAGGVALAVELARHLPQTAADRVQLQQVVVNLVINACQAMVAGPRHRRHLLVRTSRGDGGVVMTVRDTGPPVSDETLRRMFDPLFTTKPAGLGMGLSISRTIVEAHGGRLWAERNEGNGLSMHVSLPIASAAAGSAKPVRPPRRAKVQ